MKTERKTATIVGILFLLATVAGVLSFPFLRSVNDPEWLIKVSESKNLVISGALLLLIMAFACAGIAIWLYPILRKHNEALALGASGFRLMEAVFHSMALFGIIPLLVLSREYIQAVKPDALHFQTLGTLLGSVRDTASNMGLIAWCLGAAMYYYVFYQSRLIPRWLSGWGLIAIPLALAAVLLNLFAVAGPMSAINTILNFPIAIQEMVLALWLIVKGFNPAAIAAGSSGTL